MSNPRPHPPSPSSPFLQYQHPSTFLPNIQELPEPWNQLLVGGLMGEEEERCSFTDPFRSKRMVNCEDQVLYTLGSTHHKVDGRKGTSEDGYVYGHGSNEEIQASWPSWSRTMFATSSPSSCVTTSLTSSMLNLSNSKAEARNHQLDQSSECNSTVTGSASKKARVQASSTQSSTFKVRKEKLGDRIAAIHQLVSPFGKTDTASVLLEAIGYIRFLLAQIEAMSSPYLGSGTGSMRHSFLNNISMKRRGPSNQDRDVDDDEPKDLRSRGLCLAPVSFTLHIGSDNGADYRTQNLGGAFR